MRLLITGYYGAGNFGDDIMLESICKKILEENKNVKISILKMFDRKIEVDLPKKVKVINFHKVKGIFRNAAMKFLLSKHDMLLWGGGTCFTDCDGDGFYNYMKMAKEKGLKIGYLGVGVGSLTKAERINKTKYLMENLDFISLRDKKSYEYCLKNVPYADNKVHLAEDLAYLYFENEKLREVNEKKETGKNDIIISWRDLAGYIYEEKEEFLLDELIHCCEILLANENNNILILPLDDRKDIPKNKYIYNKLKDIDEKRVSLILNKTPKEKVEILKNSNVNISGRLHGIFVSKLYGIKTIGLSYSVKINEFLKSIGREEDCLDIFKLSSDEILRRYSSKNTVVDVELIKANINHSNNNIDAFSEFIREFC